MGARLNDLNDFGILAPDCRCQMGARSKCTIVETPPPWYKNGKHVSTYPNSGTRQSVMVIPTLRARNLASTVLWISLSFERKLL